MISFNKAKWQHFFVWVNSYLTCTVCKDVAYSAINLCTCVWQKTRKTMHSERLYDNKAKVGCCENLLINFSVFNLTVIGLKDPDPYPKIYNINKYIISLNVCLVWCPLQQTLLFRRGPVRSWSRRSMKRSRPTLSWRRRSAHTPPWASAAMASTAPISTATCVTCVGCRCSTPPTTSSARCISRWVARAMNAPPQWGLLCIDVQGHKRAHCWIELSPTDKNKQLCLWMTTLNFKHSIFVLKFACLFGYPDLWNGFCVQLNIAWNKNCSSTNQLHVFPCSPVFQNMGTL